MSEISRRTLAEVSGSDPLLTIDEAAALTRMSKSTLYHYRYIGGGPRSGKIGKRIFYRTSEVLRWQEEQLARESA